MAKCITFSKNTKQNGTKSFHQVNFFQLSMADNIQGAAEIPPL